MLFEIALLLFGAKLENGTLLKSLREMRKVKHFDLLRFKMLANRARADRQEINRVPASFAENNNPLQRGILCHIGNESITDAELGFGAGGNVRRLVCIRAVHHQAAFHQRGGKDNWVVI